VHVLAWRLLPSGCGAGGTDRVAADVVDAHHQTTSGASIMSVGEMAMPTWVTACGLEPEEDQIPGLKWLAAGKERSRGVLVLGDPEQWDASGGIGGFG
jgi:hypothetical protein